MGTDTVVTRLAKFCCGLRFDNLDRVVVEKIKQLVIDQLAVEVACSVLPWNQSLYDYVRMLDARGKSTVVGYGLKTNVEYAVLANSTFGHGFEIDDVDLRGGPTGHPGSITVPVAIALAETRPVSGKRMIEAVVSGYEILSAIARGIQPSSHFGRGFHAQGSGGPFASAAVAGVLRGQDVPTLANTFSLAASHAGGIMEYANTGGSVKRLHAGLAAMGGVRSAFLSQLGWTGPPTAIEGKRGFCAAFAQEYNIEAITRDLGEKYACLGTIIKPYSCNANITPAIDALKTVLAENRLTSKDVEAIEVYTSSRAMKSAGGIGPEPEDKVGAQFSIHFSLAMTLVKGSNDFNTLLAVDLKDPELIRVAKKVRMIPDKEAEEKIEKGQLWARVEVVTKNERRFSNAQYAKGTPENPMNQEEVEKKARNLALGVLPAKKVEQLIEQCRHLDEMKDVSELTR
jgi:2-methylcitrate dehydratase PrpD